MAAWQKPARLVVALVGITTAVVVYLNLGDRRHAPRGDGGAQLPPRAVTQLDVGVLREYLRDTQEYEVRWQRSTTYDDGSTTAFEVTIAFRHEGRDFVITAAEAHRTRDTREIELRGAVHARDGAGLELSTEHALFNQDTGVVRAEGAVAFATSRLTGRGTGMTYDNQTQALRIFKDAQLALADAADGESVHVQATGATLDRLQHVLTLDGPVRIVRGTQVTTTRAALARLTPEEDRLTVLELRGGSQVAGGSGALRSMRADAIDLAYAEDGREVERASLRGNASLVLDGGEPDAGRELRGDAVEVTLREGSVLDTVSAHGNVMMTLPATGQASPPAVQARMLEASAGADGTLRDAQFTDDVVFSEPTQEGRREARARTLTVVIVDGAVERARFGGSATFTDGRLQARAADADYHPGDGRLLLRGRDAQGGPSVRDDGIAIEAAQVDIDLESQGIAAKGGVKTSLHSSEPSTTQAGDRANGRLPGLLQDEEPVRITAEALAYEGSRGAAVYTGRARLLQGEETDIRGHEIEVQRERGDLTARGDARSTLRFGEERSTGEAMTIRYDDAARTIRYDADPADAAARAHVTGPQGDLRGRRIDVRLAAGESRVETLEATGGVVATVNKGRTARGATLTYHAREEQYVVTGSGTIPAQVEEQEKDTCRETRGRTLTFTRSADTMIIDGGGESRTETVRRASCR